MDEEWFKGGFCTYYENMAVGSKYGFDQIKSHRFRPMYEYYKNHIDNLPDNSIVYFKPALVAYYINELLLEHSNGTKTINDLMKILFNNALNGQALSKQSFLNALNSLTNYDFTDVVNNYLYGTEKLDLDKYLPTESTSTEYPTTIYPNPCYLNKGQVVTMANFPLTSELKVYIYDLGDNLVRTLEESEISIEGGSRTATWDCKNDNGEVVARGIYLYF
ncbi:MAG: hypothetical protein U9O41_00920 [Candidatus Aerophobetes bacterium]|nr:hypothetical protein [Candidatus Aerophobetes bacterium]